MYKPYLGVSVKMGFNPDDIKKHDPGLVIYQFVERGLFYPPDDALLQARFHASSETDEPPVTVDQ